MGLRRRAIGYAMLAVLWWSSRVATQAPTPPQETTFVPATVAAALAVSGHFGPVDFAALNNGQVITRTEASPENLEASVVTAVKIGTTKDRAADYFHLLVSYVDGQVTVGRGVFSRPPADDDVMQMKVDPADITDLNACKSDLCDIRVGGATPLQIIDAVQARQTDTLEHASAWLRQTLVSYVSDYLNRGHLALAAHDDRGVRIDVPVEWQAIFARSPLLQTLAPAVSEYLARPPQPLPPGATEEIYWDRQRYTGLKPVTGVTQMITWQDVSQPDRMVVAQKQFFATHYFFASLAVTLIEQDPAATKPTTYVVYTNRLRGDLLRGTQAARQPGLLGRVNAVAAGFQRRMGEELVKQSAEQLLTSMKQQLEK